MNRKTITLLLGLLLGLACLGVVVAKNPRLREVLTPAVGAEADAGHAHPHPHDPGDQGHSHATDAAQEGGATGAAAAPAETQAHAHPHEDDGQAHQHPPAGDRQDQAAADDHEPGTIHLDEQRMAELGIEVAAVGSGAVQGNVSLSGEIKLNTDRVAHIVPQVSGIARSVLKTVGDRVKQGEVMAWLESAKLGETKVQYLAKLAEISCCSMELTRAQEVHDNTIQLLTALESSPSLEILRDTGGAPMGKNLSQLVSAYAEWVLAQKTYTREKGLYEKQITSQGEFLKAENALKKAEAIYNATRDSVAYDVQHDLLEAQRVQRVRQIELTSAERSLYVLGLTASDLHQLERMEQQGDPTGECDDPNCPTCRRQAQEEPASGSDETDHECDDPNCQDCAGHVHAGVAAGSDTTDHHCDDPNCQDCAGRVHAGVATGSDTTDHHCDDPNCPECAGHVHAEVAAGSGASDHDCDDPNCQDCAEHVHVEVAAGSGAASCDCDDPNCQECAQEARDTVVVGSPEAGGYEERLAWYPVRAPFAGTIISKHLSTGEFVREDSEVFVIADLDTVWVDFQVHQKDLPSVREGQMMQVQIGSGLGRATGRISYVSPIVDVATRTAWARVVLPNAGRRFRPGLFVTGTVAVSATQAPIAVSELAVQYIEDKPYVFVYDDEHFEKRDVVLGRTDRNRVEIVSGLKRGEIVAVNGSFHIKAEIERQLTGAGGHGHLH